MPEIQSVGAAKRKGSLSGSAIASLAPSATLMFVVGDSAIGHPLAALRPLSDSAAKGGGLKVAPGYPRVEFSVESD